MNAQQIETLIAEAGDQPQPAPLGIPFVHEGWQPRCGRSTSGTTAIQIKKRALEYAAKGFEVSITVNNGRYSLWTRPWEIES